MQTSRLLTSINASVNGGPYPHLKVPNASVIKFLTKGPLKSNAKAGVLENPDPGDVSYDLPFSEKEARTIGEILPNSQALSEKMQLKQLLNRCQGKSIFSTSQVTGFSIAPIRSIRGYGCRGIQPMMESYLSKNYTRLSLMQAFYDRLFEPGPSGSLRHAQMQMIDSHPFYSAAFQVTGSA